MSALPSRPFAAIAGTALLALSASAQTEPGNLLVTYSASSNDSTLTEYDPDGNVVNQTTALTFDPFTSGALGPANEIIINREYGKRIEVRAPDGTLSHDFFPAEAIGQAWDIDLFADGTIAVCARGVGVVLYDQAGNYLDTFAPAGIDYPFGCQVAIDDTLWVVDRLFNVPNAGRVYQFDRAGSVLTTFDIDFEPSDIAHSLDGTLWVSDFDAGRVVQYTQDGAQLTSFDVQIDHTLRTLWSLAIDPTGAIIASGHYDTIVRYYDQTGNVLSEFDTQEAGNSLYTVVAKADTLGVPYCFGDGSGAACPCGNDGSPDEGCANSSGSGAILRALGTTIVSQDDISFEATNLLPSQPALVFAGENAPGGGNGIVFGDGLRCAGMNVVRLGTQVPDASGVATWGPGLAPMGGWSPGDTRYVQAWYRDPGSSPCGTGFNLSQGLEIVFL